MANSVVGTITYNAVINTSGMNSSAAKVNDIIGGIGKATAAVVAAGAIAVGSLVAASVKAFANYEQMVGGVETLFKGSSSTVQAYAQNAYKTAGLSANQYMSTITGFSASLLQGLGGDTKKAAEIGNMAVTDMADNANKMGTSMEMIQNAYQGFAKDNFTMLDNLKLGYGGTAGEMARLVNDSGVMGASFKATAENVKDIPFDKLILSINKVQTGLGITGTTAKEASSTISGSFFSVKSAWENVLTSFGSGNNEMIKASIDGLIASAVNLATNLSAIIPNIISGIGQLVTAFAAQLPTLLTNLIPTLISFVMTAVNVLVTAVPQFINAAIKLVVGLAQGLAQAMPKLIPEIISGIRSIIDVLTINLPAFINAAIQIIIALALGLVQALPKLIPAILEAIKTVYRTILDNLPTIIEAGIKVLVAVIQGLAYALPILIKFMPEVINTIIRVLTEPAMIRLLMRAAWDIIWAVTVGMIEAIPALISGVAQVIRALIGGLRSALGTLDSIGGDMVRGLWNGINNATGWIVNKVRGFGGAVLDSIKGFFGIKSPSTLFRDQIGKNLAFGIGEGFTDGMGQVTTDMQNAITTPNVDINSIGNYSDNNSATTVVVNMRNSKGAMRQAALDVIDAVNEVYRSRGMKEIGVSYGI